MRRRCAPRVASLVDAASSAWLPIQVLLVVRLFCAALVLAHTVLFSATRHFDYATFAVWANALMTFALLAVTMASLMLLVSDKPCEEDVESGTESDTTVYETPLEWRYPLFIRVFAAVSVPLLQIAGSSALIAAAVAFATGTAIPEASDTPTAYAALALHAGNPALFLLDVLLAAKLRERFRLLVVPWVWLICGLYVLFVGTVSKRQDVLPAPLPLTQTEARICIALAVLIPLALVAVGWILPATHAAINKQSDSEDSDTDDTPPIADRPYDTTQQRDLHRASLLHSARQSAASLGSAASSAMRASQSFSSTGSIRRVPRASSEDSAWNGVSDVAVGIESELFRMPGESDAVKLPPRIASFRPTRLL